MRGSLARLLVSHAIDALRAARQAKRDNYPDEEVRQALAAYVWIAFTIEGLGNEMGEAAFGTWEWNRIERVDGPLKWFLMSTVGNRTSFKPSEEPLQTVQKLASIRNQIAHPKTTDLGEEIRIRNVNGEIRRNVARDELLQPGDHIIWGLEKQIEEFNYVNALDDVSKGIAAIKSLRDHLNATGLDWLERLETELLILRQNP